MTTTLTLESKRKLAQQLMRKRLATQPRRYPLSVAQERLWFLEQLTPGNAAYHVPCLLQLTGHFSVPSLQAAMNAIAARHDILRTRFPVQDGIAVQEVLPSAHCHLVVAEMTPGFPGDNARVAACCMTEELQQPFSLAEGPLLRVKVLRFTPSEHYVLLVMHHIVADGWSARILLRELLHLYESELEGKAPALAPLEIQYADYSVWQREWLKGEQVKLQLAYWKKQLADIESVNLPLDYPRPAAVSYRGAWKRFEISRELVERLDSICRQQSVTMFMALLTVLQVLLKRYTGQHDPAVGAPIANRNRPEIEGLIGFFANTIVVRTSLRGDPTFRQALARVRSTTLEAYANQDLPFERLVDGHERDLSRNPLFQVALLVQPAAVGRLNLDGLTVEELNPELGGAKFDLSFSFTQSPGSLAGEIEYAADVFASSTIDRMERHFVQLLDHATANLDTPISQLPLLLPEERDALVTAWSGSADDGRFLPQPETLVGILEAQAARSPHAIAIENGAYRCTYRELHNSINQLARVLQRQGVSPEVRVAVCLPRSEQLLIALLAVLKAGGAYLPLDSAYPGDRLRFMAEDGQPALLITESALAHHFETSGMTVLCLDQMQGLIAAESTVPPLFSGQAGNAAYILYTSGSSGRPKGVVVEHKSAVALVAWALQTYSPADLDAVLFSTSVCFDLSIFEIFAPLSCGGRVVVCPNLLEWQGDGVTLVNSVPSVVAEWLRNSAPAKVAPVMNLAGEPLPRQLSDQLFAQSPSTRIWNLYGPTECTTYSTFSEVSRSETPCLGKPIARTHVYVLDEGMQLVPMGVAGELYIGGDGVGRGYWRRPELTAARFTPDIFSQQPGQRLYRTGDLVRWNDKGNLEYLGRADDQVKIHGYRIELGEIETVLSAHPQVGQSAVIVREDKPGDRRLVAYVVPRSADRAPEPKILREYIQTRLPGYMTPGAFVILPKLPLSANGKLQRRALPIPEAQQAEYVAPRTPIEEIVAGIFSAVLGLERVSVESNFFELGGHSLLATQVMSRLKTAFDVEMPLKVMFERQTVRAISQAIRGGLLEPVSVASEQSLPLSFRQQRLWFIDQLDPNSSAYNIAASLSLTGEVAERLVEQAVIQIAGRHEILRTTFTAQKGHPIQVIAAAANVPFAAVDLPEGADACTVALVRQSHMDQPFSLSRGPLFRATLFRQPGIESQLLFCMHQIVCDGASLTLIVQDFEQIYSALLRGETTPAQSIAAIRFADYASWQRKHATGRLLADEVSYWRSALAGLEPTRLLPDEARPAGFSRAVSRESFRISRDVANRLTALARRDGHTQFITVLGAIKVILNRFTGQTDITIGTVAPSRQRDELKTLVGPVENTLVLRTNLSGDPTLRDVLARVRATMLAAHAHQELPFEEIVQAIDPERDLGRQPFFQIQCRWTDDQAADMALPTKERREVIFAEGHSEMSLQFSAAEDGIEASVQYSPDLYRATTIHIFIESLLMLLADLPEVQAAALSTVRILSPADESRLLRQSVSPFAMPTSEETIAGAFAQQALAAPDAIALSGDDTSLSYRQLNERANQVARYLLQSGLRSEDRVGLCMERGHELMIAILAVIKAGGVYVPLDPSYPVERLKFMAADCRLAMVLTTPELQQGIFSRTYALQNLWEEIARQDAHDLKTAIQPDQLAYIVYTSGSTGNPKGVAVTHRGVVRLVKKADYAHLGADEVMLQLAPVSFDASTFEIWGTWLNGGQLALAPAGPSSLEEIARMIEKYQLTTLWLTAGLFHRMAEEHPSALASLRQLLAGGDVLSSSAVKRLLAANPGCEVINGYGPTENTTFSTCCCLNALETWPASTPIGRPISQSSAYVLDEWLHPVPVGVAGELYVGGAGLARGYVEQPVLTARSFVPNPFSNVPGGRLYRTGDRVRWLHDGNLEFLGRLDEQVKIRGFRVEPGEVEKVLGDHPAVSLTAVVAREDVAGDKRLVAYVVPLAGFPAAARDYRRYLLARMPEYLCPSAFVELEVLPLSRNGKVDRRALPAPRRQSSESYVAPYNTVQEILCGIWEQVLKLDGVGVNDNFFELGGHSMLATQVISRVRQVFGVEAPLRALFDSPTVAKLAEDIQQIRERGDAAVSAIVPVNRSADLPLSSAQSRLWFIEQLSPGTALYNMPFALRIRGLLQLEVLRHTLHEIVRRHEILRTCYPSHNGEPVQRILPSWDLAVPVTDLSGEPAEDRERLALAAIREDAMRGFDLELGPVLNFRVVRFGADDHALIIAMHHIAGDGWSMGVLTKELAALYDAFAAGMPSPLPEVAVQYGDFSAWQRQWFSSSVLDEQLTYWRRQLAGVPVLDFPADRSRPAIPSHHGGAEPLSVPAHLTEKLRTLSQQRGATLFMTLLAAFNVLLGRYTRQRDIAVGSVIANRNRAEIEELIGFFVNTLVLRTDLSGQPSFLELLERVKQTALDAYTRQDIPFEKLVQDLEPNRDLSRQPLFQVMFVLQNTPKEQLRLGPLHVTEMEVPQTEAKFDLSLTLTEIEGRLDGEIDYSLDLFEPSTIQQFGVMFLRALDGIVHRPDNPVFETPLLDAAERDAVQTQHARRAAFKVEQCLHTQFEEQVRLHPAAVAVEAGESSLTYAELDHLANQMASQLRSAGVGEESLAAICLDRGINMIAAMLAVLKTGAAYVPLDPGYPAERIEFIVQDTQASVLLTDSAMREKFTGLHGVMVMEVDRLDLASLAGAAVPAKVVPSNAAYVIYTSGSTGRPKGVVVTHRNVMRLFAATQREYAFTSRDVWSVFHSFAFDFSVWEIWGALLHGGSMVIVPQMIARSPEQFHDLLWRHKITVLNQTPSAFRQLQEVDAGSGKHLCVREVVFGGEALDPSITARWFRKYPASRLVNMYGITETTVHTTWRPLLQADIEASSGRSPIGEALGDLELYILDEWLEYLPEGVVGELYVGGAGLARGYLGRPELTASRFIPHPFANEPGERLYRTGDLGRRRGSDCEYMGRADEQVKIRGFRIELGEIETALRACEGVRDAVVLVREDEPGEKRLVAYLTGFGTGRATPASLRKALAQKLPEYMVPSAFVALDQFPLTPNGKLNRRALKKPERETGERSASPATMSEEIVHAIWQEVLGIGSVDADANFFEIGGHSLLATQVVARARKALGVDIPLRLLFDRPSLRGFTAAIDQLRGVALELPELPPLVPTERNRSTPMSYAQQRLWLVEQLAPGSSAYHIAGTVLLSGDLDIDALNASFRSIVVRHEALRSCFGAVNGEPCQTVNDDSSSFFVNVVDLSHSSGAERCASDLTAAEAGRPFDLCTGPLLRVMLIRLADQEHRLLVCMHHLVSDGWSVGVLMSEFIALYREQTEGTPAALPLLPVQYSDYAAWQRRWLTGGVLDAQVAHWRECLDGISQLELPTDRPRPAVAAFKGAWKTFRLNPELIAALRRQSRVHSCTLFMTMLAALQALFSKLTGQQDIAVGSPIAGRLLPEVEPLIGFFVNTIVLRGDLRGDPTFAELLERTRRTTLDAYAHQYVPFDKLVEVLQPKRDLARQPLFQVAFALQNAPAPELNLRGLRIGAMESIQTAAKFDLTISLRDEADYLEGEVEYASELFDADTIDRLIDQYVQILGQVAANPAARLAELSLLTAGDREQARTLGEGPRTPYGEECVHRLFERQAAKVPAKAAVVSGERTMTYLDLDRQATHLSHRLHELGVRPEDAVGVCLERSIELIVAFLAVLKVGAAYVPLDPKFPAERLKLMLADTQARLILTDSVFRTSVSETGVPLVEISTELDRIIDPEPGYLAGPVGPDGVAYVNYTSGSTGLPKGTVICHRSIVRLVSQTNYMRFEGSERVAHASNVAFDAATFEIWGPLLHGGTVVIIPFDVVVEPERLARRLVEDRISTLFLTTALFNRLVDQSPTALAGLDHVMFGGEANDPRRVERLAAAGAPKHLLHVYGPTETTTFATFYRVESGSYPNTIPIGRPLANTTAYVLDRNLDLVPIGVDGELFIGGPGLARGYLNRCGLTAERFVPNPFATEPGERLYRSGDIVRRTRDGEIEFVGRRDGQVKIRGFRIELAEVEAHLLAHAAIAEAIAAVHRDDSGDRQLIAYFVLREGTELNTSALRAFLKQRIPDYMLPQFYVHLAAMPLTASGKIDRRNLPGPHSQPQPNSSTERPTTAAEEILLGIWQSVLGRRDIGVTDEFFEAGGHSLLATQVVARTRAAFGVDIPLRLIFEKPTVRELCAALTGAAALELEPIQKRPSAALAPLSFAQQRLWFFAQWEGGNTAYNVPIAARLEGVLDVAALGRALREIVKRHEVLRTRFELVDGTPMQVVEPGAGEWLALPVQQVRDSDQVRAHMKEEGEQPFELKEGRLLRARLLRLSAQEHVLLLTMHHIVSDGWSMGVLVNELEALYGAYQRGHESPLEELRIQYGDYALWQREHLSGAALNGQLSYWEKQLARVPVLEMPIDGVRSLERNWQGAVLPVEVGAETLERLRALAREEGATLFMVLLAAFQLLLSKWTGQRDVAVGSPIANRTRAEVENLIGFFVNTLVLRTDVSGDPSVRQLLARVREVCLGAYAHQDLPFERLVEALNPNRSLHHSPLFQAMFTLQNAPFSDARVNGLNISILPPQAHAVNFDLSLELSESGSGLVGRLEFATALFEPASMRRLVKYFGHILDQIATQSDLAISQISLIDPAEASQLVAAANLSTDSSGPNESLVSRFETQAATTPARRAVIFESSSLTYSELKKRSDALARRLVALGTGEESRVAILLEPSLALPVAILGVLKAGAAYVPLDPEYPDDRLKYMANDSGAPVLITQADMLGRVLCDRAVVINTEGLMEGVDSSEQALPSEIHEDNAAYIIYTSGSTGKPKGVVVSHRSVLRLFDSTRRWFHFGESDVWTLFHSSAFDFSVWELWGALLHGGKLIVLSKLDSRSAAAVYALLEKHRVTVLNQTPSAFRQLQEVDRARAADLSVRCVVFGGEKLDAALVLPWSKVHPECRMINMYGITETTVHTTYRHLSEADMAHPGSSPIGESLPDLQVYVLDEGLQPVPEGVIGEIYVAGPGVARGYRNIPALTAQRFLPNPFSSAPGGRLYRSGDLARRHSAGQLEYLGRADQQVKIRGFRIELGEIETELRRLPGVRDAVVVLQNGVGSEADNRLLGYVVGSSGSDGQELRSKLRSVLPEHMIPAAFVELDEIPLTPNGKLDRQALPVPAELSRSVANAYVPPSTAVERVICEVWRSILKVDRVGVQDSFFDMGGHSLLATRVISQIQELFGVQLRLRKLFEDPTVAGLAAELMSNEAGPESMEETAHLIEQVANYSDEQVDNILQHEMSKASAAEGGQ